MSQAAAQATAFYSEVAQNRSVWSMKDDRGFPVYKNPEGIEVIPFWSSRSRVEVVQKAAPKYAAYEPLEITWDVFADKWVPSLTADQVRVGLNWSGSHATGYDVEAKGVLGSVERLIAGDAPSS
jgi:hypothetical protein